MSHPDDYDYYLSCGCTDVSHSLGIQKMPEGYALLLDADGMYFSWFERATGRESCNHWNKWAVYRGARLDAEVPMPGAARSAMKPARKPSDTSGADNPGIRVAYAAGGPGQ